MDLKDIQELIKFVAKSGATEVELEIDNVKISIKSPPKKRRGSPDENPILIQHETGQVQQEVVPTLASQSAIAAQNIPATEKTIEKTEDNTDHLITIKSSMIGTFYRSSSPEKPPFVSVGDSINTGDTICIIEAMKIMNEIESEFDGIVSKIKVDNSDPVEYNQPLFIIEPS